MHGPLARADLMTLEMHGRRHRRLTLFLLRGLPHTQSHENPIGTVLHVLFNLSRRSMEKVRRESVCSMVAGAAVLLECLDSRGLCLLMFRARCMMDFYHLIDRRRHAAIIKTAAYDDGHPQLCIERGQQCCAAKGGVSEDIRLTLQCVPY